MVRIGDFSDTLRASWEDVTIAFWRKYPNPLSAHVISADTIDRHVDPETGCLHTRRLMTKTNKKPKWMDKFFGDTTAFVVEESVLDPKAKTLRTFTKNITLNTFMTVEEKCLYTVDPVHPDRTRCVTEARVTSNFMRLGSFVEKFGIERFQRNTIKAKQALMYVLETLKEKHRVSSLVYAEPKLLSSPLPFPPGGPAPSTSGA